MVKLKRICGRAGAMALALVLMLTALAGCTSRADRENQRVIGESGGFDVLYEELRFVTLLVKDAMAGEYGADIWKTPTQPSNTGQSWRSASWTSSGRTIWCWRPAPPTA